MDNLNTQQIIAKLRGFGLTQTEIASMTGIPQYRLSRWEGGDTPQGADDALALLVLLKKESRKHSRRAAAKEGT